MSQSETFKFKEDPFAKNAQSIEMVMHESLLILKCSQTKPKIKIENVHHYDL